jgi:chromosomal replication initiation ATPase DnaA
MTPETIIAAVCEATGVTPEALVGDCRTKRFTHARYLAWMLIRDRAGLNCVAIARMFGRCHSTVVRGLEQADRLAAENERFKITVAVITSTLSERMAA